MICRRRGFVRHLRCGEELPDGTANIPLDWNKTAEFIGFVRLFGLQHVAAGRPVGVFKLSMIQILNARYPAGSIAMKAFLDEVEHR